MARALGLMLLLCCGDGSRATEPGRDERPAAADERAAEVAAPAAPDERLPVGPGFDPRLAIVRPDEHVGEERACDVAFAERVVEISGRERTRYSLRVVRRIAVQCAAPGAGGWADLVFVRERAPLAERIAAGTRVRVRVVAPDGGFAGYPVLEALAVDGRAPPLSEAAPGAEPEPAFDFGRAADPGVVGSVRRCAVDFAGRIERIDARMRRQHGYPDEARSRIAVKCRSEGGDAWIDLVFAAEEAPAALEVARGRTLSGRVLGSSGGYADRPVVRWSAP